MVHRNRGGKVTRITQGVPKEREYQELRNSNPLCAARRRWWYISGTMTRRYLIRTGSVVLGMIGCSEHRPHGAITLQLATIHPATAGAAGPAWLPAGDSAFVAFGRDTIVVRNVELVIRKIEMAAFDAGDCDGSPDEHEEPCTQLAEGILLVNPPLGQSAESTLTVPALVDTFSLLQFQIQKPDSIENSAFLSAHPDFSGTSIRLTGTYSRSGTRNDFVYTTDWGEREQLELAPAVPVTAGTTVGVTLRIDVATWFLNEDKTALVDPSTANLGQPNEYRLKDNIRMSFRAFRDADRDGFEDADEARPHP